MDLLHESLLVNVAECLECSICQDLFIEPVTLDCGHSYCMACICAHRETSSTKDCPKCRRKIRQGTQFLKNVTLCDMVKVYSDHKNGLSNVESSGHKVEVCEVSQQTSASLECQMEQEVCDVAQQTSASLEYRLEQPETPEDPVPEVMVPEVTVPEVMVLDVTVPEDGARRNVPEDRDLCDESLIASSSTDRHRAEDFPPPNPGAFFARLTLTLALGHRRLAFQEEGRKVLTKRASSARNNDRFDISQCMAEQEYSRDCHYWDVDTSESVSWAVGVARPDIGRREQLGRSAASWCLEWSTKRLSYWHDDMEEPLKHGRPALVRVVLDMSLGSLSFYGLSDNQTLLHCVQADLSGPLRPVFWLFGLQVPNALSFPEHQ